MSTHTFTERRDPFAPYVTPVVERRRPATVTFTLVDFAGRNLCAEPIAPWFPADVARSEARIAHAHWVLTHGVRARIKFIHRAAP